MAGKKPAKNVGKLISDHAKPVKREPVVAKKIRLRGKAIPPPKQPPRNVLKLIADALERRGRDGD